MYDVASIRVRATGGLAKLAVFKGSNGLQQNQPIVAFSYA